MALYYQDELLTQNLRTLLGDIDPAAIELLRQRMEWVEIAAGETLMAQGGVVAIRDSVLVRLAKSEFTSLLLDRLRPNSNSLHRCRSITRTSWASALSVRQVHRTHHA